MSSELMELKAWKLLAQIRGRMISTIVNKAQNKVEYCFDTLKEHQELMGYIANPAKWDYCGILNTEDKTQMELLEYLLEDEAKEIYKRRD